MFIKKGETFGTDNENVLLPGRKDRPRLIWNPFGDTFGLLAPYNYQILRYIPTVIKSFCY